MRPEWVSGLDGEAAAWATRGRWCVTPAGSVFVVDQPAQRDVGRAPLVFLHGFPTSSIDLAPVIDELSLDRRVVALDYLGFGLSDKPDHRYTMAGAADAVVAVLAEVGVDRCTLMSHDMGDTVCGELLARHLAGEWDVDIVDRVLTNGSIYLAMAQLTAGQQFLMALPDERADASIAPGADALSVSLAATLSPDLSEDGVALMTPAAELLVGGGGARLMARTIRYLEERRDNERRFTGAIESHPAPLRVIWGADDPIAVVAMVDALLAARPDATVRILAGVGHYPMVEAPRAFIAALRELEA